MISDVKRAARRLLKEWPFSVGAVSILAIGIGANTAIFTLVNTALFKPQPFADSGRLVNLYQNDRVQGMPRGNSYTAMLDMRAEQAVFTGVAATAVGEARYAREGESPRAGLVEHSTANLLDVLGLKPSLGRWFTEEEERTGAPVAVIGRRTWERRFGSDPRVIGQTIRIGAAQVQVIGVGPLDLSGALAYRVYTDFWLPAAREGRERRDLRFHVRARLRDGVSAAQAQAAMNVLGRRLAADYPDEDPGKGITVLPTNDVRVEPNVDGQLKAIAIGVLAIVGFVLAIACSNLATLLLVRGASRAAEFSVRLALGATRWQLARHLLLESLLLAGVGAAAGFALATWGLRYLGTLDLPFGIDSTLDYRVLSFAVGLAFVCGIGFGIAPAMRSAKADLTVALKDQKDPQGALSLTRGWFTLKNALIVGQVAASFLLMMATAFGVRALMASQPRDAGHRIDGIAMIETDPRFAGYDAARATTAFEDLRRRVAAIPGVDSAIVSVGLPASPQFDIFVKIEGFRGSEPDGSVNTEGRWASRGYFATMGIPVLFGRGFDERDRPGAPEGVVVSEAFARTYFAASNAVGKRLRISGREQDAEIVGVVGDVHEFDEIDVLPAPLLYLSSERAGTMPTAIVAHTSSGAASLVAALQREVRAFHPELAVVTARTMEQQIAADRRPWEVVIAALGGLSGIGVLLAGVGLYAVVAFGVTQRLTELGIRLALGARSRNVVWVVVRDVTVLVAVGIGIGGAVAATGMAVSGALASGIPGADPLTFTVVALALALCGAAAAFVPARRAARTDPLVAIRHR